MEPGNREEAGARRFTIRGQTFKAASCAPALYIAATPIGNLGDITLRVLETLAGCDVIACEDTRVTAKLLQHYAIRTQTTPYHEHNAAIAGPKLLEQINAGNAVTLVSDAGTPLVSDPGFRLVEAARNAGIAVIPLPGASAPLAALVASGMETQSWRFYGFLPSKQGARKRLLQQFLHSRETVIFFESPNRLIKTLEDMEVLYGKERKICVARELTKLHEEIIHGTVPEILNAFKGRRIRGEIVLILSPDAHGNDHDPDALLAELLKSLSVSQAAAQAAQLTGLPKRELYQKALSMQEEE